MLTFIVVPCLNEAAHVALTVSSLLDDPDPETHMVVVDNGSTDGTGSILQALQGRYGGRLHLRSERRRGYVPPRRTGVEAASEIAASAGAEPEEVLLLQADADTAYRSGYVAAMRAAARLGGGVVLEGSVGRPAEFRSAHPDYVAAERLVDAGIERLEAADEDDVVVDDKVCGYRLADYRSWGGLLEETDAAGEQVHAETTRMYIRARLAHGARKRRVDPAGAFPSRRRVLEDPRYHFATLGFPRTASWAAERRAAWPRTAVDEFARRVLDGEEAEAVSLRTAHLIALFRILPALVTRAADASGAICPDLDVEEVLSRLPWRERATLSERPALAITDVLELIDTQPELLLASAA